jgi:predicted transcriptional regulator
MNEIETEILNLVKNEPKNIVEIYESLQEFYSFNDILNGINELLNKNLLVSDPINYKQNAD